MIPRLKGWRKPRPEHLIALICLLGLTVSGGYLFFNKENRTVKRQAEENLGFVRPVGVDVRIKGDTDQAWNSVVRDANVFRNDRVFTGAKSEAKVKLKNRQDFTVEPSSLIIISDEKDRSTIDLSSGGFLTQIRKGVQLLVRYKGRETHIISDGATVRLASIGDDLHFVVLKGEASVGDETKSPKIVKTNEEMTIAANGAFETESHPIELLTPEAGASVWDNGEPTAFRWSGVQTLAAQKNSVFLEISQDPEFKKDVQKIESQGEGVSVKLASSNVYFWRVISEKTGSSQSAISSFSMSALTPPQLEHEKLEVQLTESENGSTKEPILLRWKDSIGSESFKLETSLKSDFSDVKENSETEKTEFLLGNPSAGTLYWRVTSRASNRPDLVSKTGQITLVEPQVKTREPAEVEPQPTATPVPIPSPTPEPTATPTPEPTPKPTPVPTPKPIPTPEPQPVAQPEKQEARLCPMAEPTPSNPKKPPIGLTLFAGAGAAYTAYQENLFDVQTSYHSLATPSWDMGAVFKVTDTIDVQASYRSTQLNFINSSVGLPDTHSQWQILALEGSSRSSLFFKPAKDDQTPYESEFRWLWGIQAHEIPFALFQNSGNTPIQRSIDLINLSLGGSYVHYINPWTRTNILMRGQYPLSSSPTGAGASFSMSSPIIFDGSIGIEKNLTGHAWLGLHWLGQYNDLHFSYIDPQVTEHGEQSAIFSTIELRLLFDY